MVNFFWFFFFFEIFDLMKNNFFCKFICMNVVHFINVIIFLYFSMQLFFFIYSLFTFLFFFSFSRHTNFSVCDIFFFFIHAQKILFAQRQILTNVLCRENVVLCTISLSNSVHLAISYTIPICICIVHFCW